MNQLPLFLAISGQKILLQGEGEAADAKARLITEAGGQIVGSYEPGVRLAFVADVPNPAELADQLRSLGLLVNVVDHPALSDFFVPAIINRNPVLVAIGTGGASASLSKSLKERLDYQLPANLGALAQAMARAKASVAASYPTIAERRRFWAELLAPGGVLDPFISHANPDTVILGALAGENLVENCQDLILVGLKGAEALTLGELRLMAQADLVVHEPGVPIEVLSLLRRDAARQLGTSLPDDRDGRLLLIRIATGETPA